MKYLLSTLALGLALISSPVLADEENNHANHKKDSAEEKERVRIGDPWPLDTCVVSGEKLGSMGDPIIYLHEGREVRFCCEGCIGSFEKDPDTHLAAADKKIMEQQKKFYPLENCIIDTAEAISETEEDNHYSVVFNRLFVYCCPPCDKKVREEPVKYFEILDKAVIEKQKEAYPLETCVISGQPLDSMGGPVSYVIANRLVQLCCAACEKKVEDDPVGVLLKIAKARSTE